MRGVQNEVARAIHKFGLLQRCGTPAKKHQSVSLSVQYSNRSIGELLPPFLSVRKCSAFTHGKYCVEQKHTLRSPGCKISVTRYALSHVAVNFLENISQGRRNLDSTSHRKCKTVCLSGTCVRALVSEFYEPFEGARLSVAIRVIFL